MRRGLIPPVGFVLRPFCSVCAGAPSSSVKKFMQAAMHASQKREVETSYGAAPSKKGLVKGYGGGEQEMGWIAGEQEQNGKHIAVRVGSS